MGFLLRQVFFSERLIPLCAGDIDEDQNYCTILIGKNGSGKSRLLAEICRCFDNLDVNQPSLLPIFRSSLDEWPFELHYSYGANHVKLRSSKLRVEIANPHTSTHLYTPKRVIATTITPFDKFPIGRNRHAPANTTPERQSLYKYQGSKNYAGQISSTGKISRVIESLIFASEKSRWQLARLRQIFEFLGYSPRISVDYLFRFRRHLSINDLHFLNRSKDVNNYLEILTSDSRKKSALHAEFQRDLGAMEEVTDALNAVLNSSTSDKELTIELDFASGEFRSGSIDLYRHVIALRRRGLLSLSNLRLTKINHSSESINLKDASSGEQGLVLTFLGIASEIEDNSLIIIDEPEISLHPEWQEKFVDLLMSTFSAYSGCHFLLATHSPLLLTKADHVKCSIVMMDENEIVDAKNFLRKSADFQLATAFKTPGFGNEYLAREGLTALRLAAQMKFNDPEFLRRYNLLCETRSQLEDSDPVAQLTDALVLAQKGALHDN